jgi:NH3-dependent NAD+ synthetase
MSNGAESYTADERKFSYNAVLDHIKGTVDTQSAYDAYDDLELTSMRTQLDERLQKATLEDRTELNFKLALYRSLRYASASSKHCLVLGTVNNLRELYEGLRITRPSSDEQ